MARIKSSSRVFQSYRTMWGWYYERLVTVKPGTARSAGQHLTNWAPGAPTHQSIRDAQAVLITSFSHMHLSSDAKDLLYKCSILTAMMRRLTSILFCHTFRKLTFRVNKINHKNVVKRKIYRMRRLILVVAIHTCYKCHFSCTCTAQLYPDHAACVTKFTL